LAELEKKLKNENFNHPFSKKLEPKLSFIFEQKNEIDLLKNVKNQN
jgi:hypothetical protein